MNTTDQIKTANDLLTKVLSFFPRVDTKANALLAINTGMLAILVANSPSFVEFNTWYMFIPLVPILIIGMSIWHVYKCSFPKLGGGNGSLIYFQEIANRTEVNYLDEFKALTEDKLLKDLVGQIWRNSEVLKLKYQHIKWAFNLLALAIVPWILSLGIFISRNNLVDSLLK